MANEDLVTDDDSGIVEANQNLSEQYELFCRAYVNNGNNATQAYIVAGYSSNGAGQSAHALLKRPEILRRIATLTAPRLKASGLTLENTLAQISAIANFDKRKLYDADGNKIPVHLLDDETAAAISHFTAHDLVAHDKTKALDMAAKYFGIYEKDNSQKAESLAIQINLV